MASRPWQEIAKEAQELRGKSIAAVEPALPDIEPEELPLNVTSIASKHLSLSEIKITESSPEQLVKSLASAELSCVEVTNAFLRRAGLAQKLTNCLTTLLPTQALTRAAFLDDLLRTHGAPIGPLHGLPISVKEHIGMSTLPLTAGFVSWSTRTSPYDAHILTLLHRAGAVFYARTTEPQTLMHLETSSNLYGVTVNPFNRTLTSGGSSGGEGALLGLRGSCLGIGTDIGGSIRSPAAHNGVYGLRPTSHRLPLGGVAATMLHQEHIVPVIGPLSTSLEGCKLFMKTLLDQTPWVTDPILVPVPWRMDTDFLMKKNGTRKLKVGVMYSDNIVRPHPPITRALRETIAKLSTAPDIEVIEWTPYRHDLAWQIIASLYFADGGAEEKAALAASDEPLLPLSRFIIHDNPFCKELSVQELWKLTGERNRYRDEYARLWNETARPSPNSGIMDGEKDGGKKQEGEAEAEEDGDGDGDGREAIDVLLCPVAPGVAPVLGEAKYWAYTAQWNLLDYPALVFPLDGMVVDQDKDPVETGYTPMNEQDRWNHELYAPERYVDAPISLQVVGRRFDDEKIIQALEFMREKAKI